uniref:Uncharacterized protein n=1 Tax=Anguilla anguilla TaxID=7936 RepID=A0A0E9R4P5_ANGAN
MSFSLYTHFHIVSKVSTRKVALKRKIVDHLSCSGFSHALVYS